MTYRMQFFLISLILIQSSLIFAADFSLCPFDKEKQKARSDEIASIIKADQEARKNLQLLTPEHYFS